MIRKSKKFQPKAGPPLAEKIKRTKNKRTKLAVGNKKNKQAKIVKIVSQKTAKKPSLPVILKNTSDDQEVINLDHFLVDEQKICSTALAKAQLSAASAVIKEIDQLIKAEAASPFNLKELLPKGEFKIQLNCQGRLATINKTHQTDNSAYLINLKKPQAEKKKQLDNNFAEASGAAGLAPSLLKPHSLRENFKDLKSVWLAKFNRLFSRYSRPKPAFKESSRWLFNLKAALNFAFIALLLILPIRALFFYQHLNKTKGQVLGVSEEAWQELKQGALAASQADWQNASFSFALASDYLAQAQATVEQYRHSLLDLIKLIPVGGQKVASLENLLLAGQSLSSAAENLTKIFSAASGKSGLEQIMTIDFAFLVKGLGAAQADLEQSFEYLAKVQPEAIPEEYRQSFLKFSSQLKPLTASLKQAEELFVLVMEILGQQAPKRYLVMLQNTNEARPSGGFFGTFALMDLKKGKIVNLEVPPGGTYDLKGYYTGPKIKPPIPLSLISSAWSAWDANYFADFPSSAQKVMWFFEQSGWPSVDGVIAINSSLIPELLKIVGNIELPKYNKVLTPEDAILALEHATLFEYDRAKNAPKEIITDLTPVLLERLFSLSGKDAWPLILTLEQALQKKEIQLYFADQSLEERVKNKSWAGELKSNHGDYLLAVDTNVAGGKTNSYLASQINLYSYVQADGSIINTVAITRHHHGNEIDPKHAAYVFAKDNNVSYLRIYVPPGSQLLEVTGQNPPAAELFKEPYPNFVEDEYLKSLQGEVAIDPKTGTAINQEFDKTVFGNWLQVKPGEEKTLTFSYRLPFKISLPATSWWSRIVKLFRSRQKDVNHNYSLLVQRQSGAQQTTLKSFLFLPDNLKVDWLKATRGSEVSKTDQGAALATDLATDQYYAAVLSQR